MAVVVLEPVPVFELGIACEVFGLDRTGEGLPGYAFAVCAARTRPMRSTTGLSVTTTEDLSRLATADLVIVAAAAPPPRPTVPARLLAALQAAMTRGANVAGVCAGAFVLAEAGLLEGRRATTHWMLTDALARAHPNVRVEPDSLYVEDGGVLTSAGSAAALDLCLHLVRRAHGAEVANRIARRIVVPPHRDGGQAQYVETPVADESARDGLGPTLDWARQHLSEPLTVSQLASRAQMSDRTFARRFRETTGLTPRAWLDSARLTVALAILETRTDTVDRVAQDTGFGSADTLRRHLVRARGVTPDRYRQTFRRLETEHRTVGR